MHGGEDAPSLQTTSRSSEMLNSGSRLSALMTYECPSLASSSSAQAWILRYISRCDRGLRRPDFPLIACRRVQIGHLRGFELMS